MRLLDGHRVASPAERNAFHITGAVATAIAASRAVNIFWTGETRPDALLRKLGWRRHVHHYVPGVSLHLARRRFR